MSLLNKFINSISASFNISFSLENIHPVVRQDYVPSHHTLLFLSKGHVFVGKEALPMQEGSFYLMTKDKPHTIKIGDGKASEIEIVELFSQEYIGNYFRRVNSREEVAKCNELITIVNFDVLLHGTLPFFETMELPAFTIPPDQEMGDLVRRIAREYEQDQLGRSQLLTHNVEELVIRVCRYIAIQPEFEKNITNLEFLSDPRLADIFKYINENLSSDLSNSKLASIVNMSEDYVGQYFKSVTGRNLQQYIETKRLEQAMHLLHTRPHNIQEIAHKVGFKDPAYFSRRFKIKFGVNAATVRSQKNQVV